MKLTDVKKILRESDALILDEVVLSTPSVRECGKDDPFMVLKWWDEEGLFYEIELYETENAEVGVAGGSLFFQDTEGEEIQITPTFRRDLEKV